MPTSDNRKRLHYDLENVGLRAQATAVGLVQLCIELRRANVLEAAALERIKDAIADEVTVNAPRSVAQKEHRRDMKARLDRIFAGEEELGSGEALAYDAKDEKTAK